MKIKEIEIRSLFGYFDHKIPLKEDDRITIIHGPNGVGKTTVLRLISDLFEGQFHSLLITPFDRIVVHFKPEGSLTVIRTKEEDGQDVAKLELIYHFGKERAEYAVSPRAQESAFSFLETLEALESMDENIKRVGPYAYEWYEPTTGKVRLFDESKIFPKNSLPLDIRKSIIPVPKEIERLLEQIHIIVLETQRLFTRDNEEELTIQNEKKEVPVQRMTVEQYSEDMVSRIKECQRESGEVGASLDGSFPQRLLESGLPQTVTEENIGKKYIRQSKYRDRLRRSGLIAAKTIDTPPPKDLAENALKILWIYLGDVERKLKVFTSLLHRVELFKDIVNSHFLYKKFKVDREKGFIFKSDHDGSIVPTKALSSGEQHTIVLTYELLFKAPAGSLIFLDEPELSLHVSLQRKFLKDIARISKLADLDFLIATHSPSIIHNRRDLMVKLAGKEEG